MFSVESVLHSWVCIHACFALRVVTLTRYRPFYSGQNSLVISLIDHCGWRVAADLCICVRSIKPGLLKMLFRVIQHTLPAYLINLKILKLCLILRLLDWVTSNGSLFRIDWRNARLDFQKSESWGRVGGGLVKKIESNRWGQRKATGICYRIQVRKAEGSRRKW